MQALQQYAPRGEVYTGIWNKDISHTYFALNILHTAINVARSRGYVGVGPERRAREVGRVISNEDFYVIIKDILEILGFPRNMGLDNQHTRAYATSKNNYSTLIQECTGDNKQRHIFMKKFVTTERDNPLSKLYRKNLFHSPAAREWFNEDPLRWMNARKGGVASPPAIRYFGPSLDFCIAEELQVIILASYP